MEIESGSYVGDGVSPRTITLSSVTQIPSFVWVHAKTLGTPPYIRMPNFATDKAHETTGQYRTDAVVSAAAGSFTVQSFQNFSSNTFHYFVCTPASGPGTADNTMAHGTYSGNNDTQTISGLSFQPELLYIVVNELQTPIPVFRDATMPADLFATWDNFAWGSSTILNFTSNGFQIVGSSSWLNKAGFTYSYVAFSSTSAAVHTGTYTGDGTASRSLTGAGFSPLHAVVRKPATATFGVWKGLGHAANKSQWCAAVGEAATGIIGFHADGITVDSSTEVNASGGTYYWHALGVDAVSVSATAPALAATGSAPVPEVVSGSTASLIGAPAGAAALGVAPPLPTTVRMSLSQQMGFDTINPRHKRKQRRKR